MLATGGLHVDQAPPLSIPFRFFATAPFFLILCGVTLYQEGVEMILSPLMPMTVTVLHVITLGWIAMVMFGAMYQMIPVLGGLPVPWPGGPRWVHPLLVIGVVTFYLGVGLHMHRWLLLVTSFTLTGAVILFAVPVGIALLRAPVVHPTVWAMRIAIVSLLGGLTMGMVFLGEYAHGFLAYDRQYMIGVHLIWAFFGWVTTLMIGVSFHILPMFYMMPVYPRHIANRILFGLTASWLVLPPILLLEAPQPWMIWLGALPAVAALITYAVHMIAVARKKRRRKADVTFRLWQTGYLCGALALLVMATWPVVESDRYRFLFVALFLFGWVSSVMIGMLHRIIPFLTWFHRYSAKAGMPGVPMMDDLTPGAASRLQLWNHWLTIVLLVAAVWTGSDLLFRLTGASLCLTGALLWHLLWFALRRRDIPASP